MTYLSDTNAYESDCELDESSAGSIRSTERTKVIVRGRYPRGRICQADRGGEALFGIALSAEPVAELWLLAILDVLPAVRVALLELSTIALCFTEHTGIH